jgi:Amt family ammonium transporter
VAGLVAITPASGFVEPWAALIFGIISGIVCHFAGDLKHRLRYDDALDVFSVHGVGGLVGNLLTGIFADASIASLDNASIPGGWVNGHWIQLPIQMAASAAGASWAFAVTFIILFVMNKIPVLRLRVDEEEEALGLDVTQMGEYNYDQILKSGSSVELNNDTTLTSPTTIDIESQK